MNLKAAYYRQKSSAKLRGIPWEFSFESWERFWIESGKLSFRGKGRGMYVMARFGDSGSYCPGNVKAILHEENSKEARNHNPVSSEDLRARLLGKGAGWTRTKNGRYQVVVCRLYVGVFLTAESAEKARSEAIDEFNETGDVSKIRSKYKVGRGHRKCFASREAREMQGIEGAYLI